MNGPVVSLDVVKNEVPLKHLLQHHSCKDALAGWAGANWLGVSLSVVKMRRP